MCYLSFPAHGTISVSGIILFMATQVEVILPSASIAVIARGIVNSVGLPKFLLGDFNVLIKSSGFFCVCFFVCFVLFLEEWRINNGVKTTNCSIRELRRPNFRWYNAAR